MLERIRGQEVDIRHILLTPKVDEEQLESRNFGHHENRILQKEITFEEAEQFSSEKETRLNGGSIINPTTGDEGLN